MRTEMEVKAVRGRISKVVDIYARDLPPRPGTLEAMHEYKVNIAYRLLNWVLEVDGEVGIIEECQGR